MRIQNLNGSPTHSFGASQNPIERCRWKSRHCKAADLNCRFEPWPTGATQAQGQESPRLASLHGMDKMKKFRKASQLQSTTKSLDTLTVEMAAPVVTASAMREMQHFKRNRRKLQLIDSFHRYARSSCGCRFPESREPQGHTLSEARRLRKVQRESQFAQHVCVFDAFLSLGGVVSWRL